MFVTFSIQVLAAKLSTKAKFQKFARFKFKDFLRIFKYSSILSVFKHFQGLEVFIPNSSIFKDFSSML